MISRLIDFVLVVLLFVFKVCGIIGISKIVVFHFFGTGKVKEDLIVRFELSSSENVLFCVAKIPQQHTKF